MTAKRSGTPESEGDGRPREDDSAFRRFRDRTKRLVSVPKKEIKDPKKAS